MKISASLSSRHILRKATDNFERMPWNLREATNDLEMPLNNNDSMVANTNNNNVALFALPLATGAYGLFGCYSRAVQFGDMRRNPDWSVSRIMAYEYNTATAFQILLPSMLWMILLFARKHRAKQHIQVGAQAAFLVTPFVFIFDVVSHPLLHLLSFCGLFTSTWSFKRELTYYQSVWSNIMVVVGFIGAFLRPITNNCAFGALHGGSEVAFLLIWATMMLNE